MVSPDDPPRILFADRPWELLPEVAVGRAAEVPSMLNPRERRLYTWLTARWVRGQGAVVDLGCFVGGSTACLAQGVALAGHDLRVRAYDRFTANDAAKERFLYSAGVAPFEGSDTLPLCRSLLAPWSEQVALHRGDILEQVWSGGPIELLVVDIAKSTRIADHVARQFYSALIPGRSILVHQDFLHDAQPWLPVQMELLADFFTPLAHVAPDSMSYLCTAVPDGAALAAARTDDLDDAAMIGLLERARERHGSEAVSGAITKMVDRIRANPGLRDAGALRRAARKAQAGRRDRAG